MRIVVLDFESFYTDQKDERGRPYTLTHLSTEDYIRHPWFQVHGAAVKWNHYAPAVWYDEPILQDVFTKQADWSNVFLICHHTQFDGFILSHHYGMVPRMYGCTLSMARLLLGNHLSVSLDSVRKHFGLPAKSTPYHLFKGKRWNEMSPAVQQQVAAGACDEVESIWKIFGFLTKTFPKEEYETIDTTIRMFTQPSLRGDISLLAQVWQAEATKKKGSLEALGVTKAELQSANRFRALLEAEGVEIEYKDGKDGLIPCFAKTDQFIRDLLEDPRDRVRALAAARIVVKSTLEQTRAETLGWMASRGPMPVYLRYAGAHTTRWSGGDGCNWQNFTRGSDIRKAIMAPEGYLLAPIDLSQIECIAEGQRVLTQQGWKPINLVDLDDFAWDGEDWVAHQGLVCYGEKSVIAVDGLVATEDHVIYPKQFPNGVTLGDFERSGYSFAETRWENAVCEKALRSRGLSWVRDVWKAWDTLLLPNGETLSALGIVQPSTSNLYGGRDRSYRQRRALRTWKFAIINAARKCQQSLYDLLGALSRWFPFGNARFQTSISRMQLWARSNKNSCQTGFNWGENNLAQPKPTWITHGNNAYRQEKRTVQKARVYDLLNCGPRHRFMCEGVLVSNCRILNYLAGQEDVINRFRSGADPYVGIASRFYGRDITRSDTLERGTGKQAELSCGYGCGAAKFQATAKLGIYGPPVFLTIEQAQQYVDLYRSTHPKVVAYWGEAGRMISWLAGGPPLDWGPMKIKNGKIYLPNGCPLDYSTLEYYRDSETGEQYWRHRTRNGWSKLYGAKLVENVVQALARVVMSQAMIRITLLGYRIVNCTHDELLVLVPKDGKEQSHLDICMAEMKKTPFWLPGIPLDCEGSLGERYAK